jgi:SAM-dependent methyltransferase
MDEQRVEDIRRAVRDRYSEIAKEDAVDCGCAPSCCGGGIEVSPEMASAAIGYSEEELHTVPQGANMGLGCGNPQAIADLKQGEVVLDLGAGGGFDCFLAAQRVGETGKVIGVDMTPEMVAKARENARSSGYDNVEFRLGEIEHLPVADGSVDVIISNCVINLSADKPCVYRDAFRALKPGGRLAISDVIATAPLTDGVRDDLALHSACIAGAITAEEVDRILTEVGFQDIRIRPNSESREFIREWAPELNIEDHIVSATIEATKPVD